MKLIIEPCSIITSLSTDITKDCTFYRIFAIQCSRLWCNVTPLSNLWIRRQNLYIFAINCRQDSPQMVKWAFQKCYNWMWRNFPWWPKMPRPTKHYLKRYPFRVSALSTTNKIKVSLHKFSKTDLSLCLKLIQILSG